MKWILPISIAGIITPSVAELNLFNFGGLHQYIPRQENSASLSQSSTRSTWNKPPSTSIVPPVSSSSSSSSPPSSPSSAELESSSATPTPEPTPTPTPTPQAPTKALNVMSDQMQKPKNLDDYGKIGIVYFQYFTTDYGKTVDCRNNPVRTVEKPVNSDPNVLNGRTYPDDEFDLTLWGQTCTYKNPGDSTGELFCGDQKIECFWDPADKDPASGKDVPSYLCDDTWARQTIFTCPW